MSGSIVRLSAHDEVCNGWTSIDNYTVFFLCVLRVLCGEPCISISQPGSYLAWQLGQMRMILQVSFVNRTNDVWKPSSYPQFWQIWSSFFIFIETGFGVISSSITRSSLFTENQLKPQIPQIAQIKIQKSREKTFLSFAGSILQIEPFILPVDTLQPQQTLIFISRWINPVFSISHISLSYWVLFNIFRLFDIKLIIAN